MDSSSDESDSDEDDTAALMAELDRIKKERAAEKAEKEAQEEERQVFLIFVHEITSILGTSTTGKYFTCKSIIERRNTYR